MTINIGNNKIKKLHKGNELIVQVYKGDELIYLDLESLYAYKFTIDTRLQQDGTSSSTDNTMILACSWELDQSQYSYGKALKIYWGDGTQTVVDTTDARNSYSMRHEYATAGEYQISIVPIKFENRLPIKGWLSCLSYTSGPEVTTGVNYTASPWKIKTIDTPIPERGMCFGPPETGKDYSVQNLINLFARLTNIENVPDDWLDNIEVRSTGTRVSGIFSRIGQNGKAVAPNKILSVIQKFSARCDGRLGTAESAFYGVFCGYDEITIPDDFFTLTASGSSGSNYFGDIFRDAFKNCKKIVFGERLLTLKFPTQTDLSRYSSDHIFMEALTQMENVTWPECLVKIDAPEAKKCGGLFGSQSFLFGLTMRSGYSTVLEINNKFIDYQVPKLEDGYRLFSWSLPTTSTAFQIKFKTGAFTVTNNVKSAESMFSGLFYGQNDGRYSIWEPGAININMSQCTSAKYMFANHLGNAPIDSSVIIPMNTDNVIDFSGMFSSSLSFAYSKAASIIWQDIISSTTNGVNFKGMFQRTYQRRAFPNGIPANFFNLNTSNGTDFSNMFEGCFYWDDIELPTGLFSHIDTSNGTNFSSMFKSLNGRVSKTPVFPLNDIFDGMPSYNFATQANVDSGMLDRIFGESATTANLSGAASTILQHFPFDPTVRTYAFLGQSNLSDYATINANWK